MEQSASVAAEYSCIADCLKVTAAWARISVETGTMMDIVREKKDLHPDHDEG